ncbi:MAG TPA: winged helix DNA-binding domain-containing protein [Actinomycetes bacterium]
MTWAEVSGRRFARQGLTTPMADAGPADAAAAMCGAHAQVQSAAELSIGLRLTGVTQSDIRAALWTERSVVKTFGPRGTVHLLPSRDLPMWCAALSAIPPARSPFTDDVRMTTDQTEAVLAAIADALVDAELTIDELTSAIVERTGSWAGDLVMPAFQGMWPRWRQALSLAGTRGVLCYGPNRGRTVTYTSPQRWIPDLATADSPTAPEDLLRRYLTAYGPATPEHYARWLNAPPTWSAKLFESVDDELESVEVEGTLAWQLVGDDAPTVTAEGVRLLPYFDAYAVAGQPRSLLFPPRAAERALAGGQAGNFPVLLVDGTVAGVWHHRRAGRKVAITVEPLSPLTSRQRRGLDEQVDRVGEILEATAALTVGTVSVGPHA